MKIAISTDGDQVSAHFGRCPSFTLIEVEDGKVKDREVISNPGHHPGFLPQFFHENGVEYIIAGGAGQRAQGLFAERGIKRRKKLAIKAAKEAGNKWQGGGYH